MSEELVTQNCGICLKLDPINGNGWCLCNHDAPYGVGNAQIGVLKLELDNFLCQFCKRKAKIDA